MERSKNVAANKPKIAILTFAKVLQHVGNKEEYKNNRDCY